MKKYRRVLNGKEVILSFLEKGEIENYEKISPVTQVSGLCFTEDGKVLIVSSKPGKWGIPGGKPEINESLEETLKRETMEESCVEIEKIKLLGFVKVHFEGNPNKNEGDDFYQARCFAIVKKINPIKTDPATGIKFSRKFVLPEEFIRYVKWPDAKHLISLALKNFECWRKNFK